MFAVHEVTVEAPFDVATARLTHMINQGALSGPSQDAYEGGLSILMRVGPFGGRRGLSKLVQVLFLDPVRRDGTMTVSLRWEATGRAGELFPMLDADLTVAADGADRVRLTLAGAYRPPFGQAGVALDRAVMRAVAAATMKSLTESFAEAVADPVAEPLPRAGFATWPLPVADAPES